MYKESGLKLSLKKCNFAQKSAKYLGLIVSNKEIQIDPIKVQGMKDNKAPTNVKEVKRFLGMLSYYRKFISNFSEIYAPLTNLIKKYSNLIWT